MQPLTPFKNMMNYRLLLIPRLFVALLLAPIGLSGVFAQESDSGQVDDGSTSERKPGITVIVDAAGAVQVIDKPGASSRPAKKGDRVPVEGTVVTGADGQANLALSNGAFFQIHENSSFSIPHFEQSAFEFVFASGAPIHKKQVEELGADEAVVKCLDASENAWNDLPAEPTESSTGFALNYGTMIGESKKLKNNSQMNITTPIGAAGIRGTIWRLTTQKSGGASSNQFRGTLDVSEGRVDFSKKDGTSSVQVKSGFGMNVQATVLPNGAVSFDSLGTNRMSPERAQLLVSSIKEVAQVQQAFTAVQGSPEVLINTLKSMQGVDLNSAQAVSDAALTLLSGDAAQTQQVTNLISALVITRADPGVAPRIVSEVVSSILTQSPTLAPNVVSGVVATTSMAAKNEIASLALGQTITRAAVASAVTTAPAQVAAITASGISLAASRGSDSGAPAISSAIVGAAITALPAQANLIAATAVNAAANANVRQEVAQNVVAAVANSAAVNAAYAAISNGGDRQAAEQAAAAVAETVRETAANTQFAEIATAASSANAIQQSVTQAQNSYDRGETPNTDGSSGVTGGPESRGDTGSKSQVDTQSAVQPVQPPPPPPQATPTPQATPIPPQATPIPSPEPSPSPSPTPTPTPTPSPHPSDF